MENLSINVILKGSVHCPSESDMDTYLVFDDYVKEFSRSIGLKNTRTRTDFGPTPTNPEYHYAHINARFYIKAPFNQAVTYLKAIEAFAELRCPSIPMSIVHHL